MAITAFESCKKQKRTPKIFTIHSFATPASPMDGPFRDNIRLFLQQCSEKEDYIVENNPVWCTLFLCETNGVVFPLYIVEQNVQQSSDPFCDFCRCVGWSHHFVSKRRYHLIIPENIKWSRPLNMDSIEFDTHLLHGVIHCNGYGHLLSINGTKDYSNYLCGEELMNLWDCLCSCLRTQAHVQQSNPDSKISRWNAQRLEYTAKIIVNILVEHARTNSGGSVTRQELRDEARKHVGDTGRDVYGDMLKLYKNVLLGYPESHPVSLATRTILNSKSFVKEWQFKGDSEENLSKLICWVMPSYDELVTELSRPLPPGELVVV
ncbi:hypothetical protein QYF36_025493 [Acer negundo]|nr:hypothetical protein QYF36_025493 [Acer negundo]